MADNETLGMLCPKCNQRHDYWNQDCDGLDVLWPIPKEGGPADD